MRLAAFRRFPGQVSGVLPGVVSSGRADGIGWLHRFRGFAWSAKPTDAPTASMFCSRGFRGFVNDAPRCVASTTMAGLHKGLFRGTWPPIVPMESVWLRRFRGFVRSAEPTSAPTGYIFCSSGFRGFVNVRHRARIRDHGGTNKRRS